MTVLRETLSTRLRFGVLGPLVATLDDQVLALGGRRQRSVIAALLLARGEVVSSDRLLEALWPDGAPRSAAGSLHAYVSHLRRLLEPGRAAREPSTVLVSQGSGYALRVPEEAVDAWRFTALVTEASSTSDPGSRISKLREGLRLWRGPALAEYAEEDWARPDARRLTDLRSLAREQLVSARLDSGETAILVPEIEALIAEEPLREEPWRLLALAQYRSQRQADALATLRRARTLLAEELGVDPGPALRSLEAEILAQSEALTAPRAVGTAHAPAPAPSTSHVPEQRDVAPAEQDDLVEREHELALLRTCLEDALNGQAGLALVTGPAGIGKSRLLGALRQLAAARGATVLSARGSQLEKAFGFGMVRQLFDPVLAAETARATLLNGAAAAADAVFDATSPLVQPRSEGVFGVLHGLYWLTHNLSDRAPLVLAVDDLQYCDTGSLRYLAYLLRRLEGMPLLVVGSLRTGEEYDDEGLLNELAADPATVLVSPEPLSRDGVADLVRARLGPATEDPFVTACYRTTAGNPLLLRQLLRALEAEQVRPDTAHADTVRAIGSRAVSSLVLMRFSRMPPENRRVARAVAVLGDGASLPAVAAMTELSEDAAAAAIASLARAEVLREHHPLGFVHPLVGDAVYGDLSVGERELAHDQAARVLAAMGAAPEQTAAHLLLVPPRGDLEVVRVLREAARRDVDRGAAESAVAYLRRALAEPPLDEDLPELLMWLGRVEEPTHGASAIEHLGEAYRSLEDPGHRAQTAIMLARTLVFGGEKGRASAFARQAIDQLSPELVDERQGLLALQRFAGYLHDLPGPEYARDIRPSVEGAGTGARALAAALAWEDLTTSTHRDRAIAKARFAVEDGRLQEVDAGLLWVVAGIVLEMSGEDTVGFWEGALRDAHRQGALFAAMRAHLWLGWTLWTRGDLQEALQSLATCAEQNQLWGANPIGQAYVDGFSIPILLDRGDVAAARRTVDLARPRERFGDGRRLYGEGEAAVLLAEGRPREALARLDEVHDLMTRVRNPVWRSQKSQRGVVLAALGSHDEAVRLVEEDLAAARDWGTPELVGRTLRILGEIGTPDRVDVLREAVDLLEQRPQLLERAKAQAALGEALLTTSGTDARRAALSLLRQALALAEQSAAVPLRERIARALRSLGVDVPAEPPARSSLTRTERRIVGLALEGALEREIAESLFITPRTVQNTLESVSQRLRATTLDDLRGALDEV
ncbi:MAG TPA: BTAD domain-containing putative transcriptional regulator [Nocardioidaceae bacterium]|nr:BTAD domain-containing putative transcriptional regulator [Nocardioidaceae bacterium]